MRNALRIIALSSTWGVAALAVQPVSAMPFHGGQDQEHHDRAREQSNADYSSNRYYKLGSREGYQDYQRKSQRKEHKHKYRSDDDRRAHDAGYQQGWQGEQGNRHNTDHDDNHHDNH